MTLIHHIFNFNISNKIDIKNSWAKIITNKSEAAAPNIQSQQQYPFNNTANKFGTKDNGVTSKQFN